MTVQQTRPASSSERTLVGFGRFLFAGILWLVVGVLAGRYLFPEVKVEVLERRVEVEKRVEVPVDRIVERVVIKEVEKRVEVPVEKIVIREVQVPAPVARHPESNDVTKPASAWDSLKVGMTKSEVVSLLGEPYSVLDKDAVLYWYYSERQSDFLIIRFKVAGLFGFDRVEHWIGPDPRMPKR